MESESSGQGRVRVGFRVKIVHPADASLAWGDVTVVTAQVREEGEGVRVQGYSSGWGCSWWIHCVRPAKAKALFLGAVAVVFGAGM